MVRGGEELLPGLIGVTGGVAVQVAKQDRAKRRVSDEGGEQDHAGAIWEVGDLTPGPDRPASGLQAAHGLDLPAGVVAGQPIGVYTKALRPVMARPTMRVFISLVPS